MPGERTEQATQHRREKARKEGDILHSRELSAAAGTLAGVMALGVWAAECDGGLARARSPDFSRWALPAHWEPATHRADAGRHAAADARGAGCRRRW